MRIRRRKKTEATTEVTPIQLQEKGAYTASICGHPTKIKGRVTAFGKAAVTEMPLVDGQPKYCLACIGGMAIRCAWCGEVIFIGDPITLYRPKRGFEIPDHAVRYDRKQLVGCLGWDCAETGGDRSGFWIPNDGGRGEVFRVLSPLEQAMMGGEVVVADLSDPSQAIPIAKR